MRPIPTPTSNTHDHRLQQHPWGNSTPTPTPTLAPNVLCKTETHTTNVNVAPTLTCQAQSPPPPLPLALFVATACLHVHPPIATPVCRCHGVSASHARCFDSVLPPCALDGAPSDGIPTPVKQIMLAVAWRCPASIAESMVLQGIPVYGQIKDTQGRTVISAKVYASFGVWSGDCCGPE